MKAHQIKVGKAYALKHPGAPYQRAVCVSTGALMEPEKGPASPKGSVLRDEQGNIIVVPNRLLYATWEDYLGEEAHKALEREAVKRQRRAGRLDRAARSLEVDRLLRARGIPELPRPVPSDGADGREEVAIDMAETGWHVFLDEHGVLMVLAAFREAPRNVTSGAPIVLTTKQLLWLLTTDPASN